MYKRKSKLSATFKVPSAVAASIDDTSDMYTSDMLSTSDDPFSIYTGPEEEEKIYKRKSSTESLRESTCTITTREGSDNIYYFGVGPIVHPKVRKRQGVEVSEDQAAVLNDYRLTFVKGGVANVVASRGYEVHGVVMKFESCWEEYMKVNCCSVLVEELVEVFPYDGSEPILANVFSLREDDVDPDSNMKELAQERYLRLIADGLRKYQIEEEYIANEIMSVPFVPNRQFEDWERIPCKDCKDESELPKISFRKYQHLCRKQRNKKVHFIIGCHVMEMVIDNNIENPGMQWFLENAHGKPDMTWTLHQIAVDPNISVAESPSDLTPLHTAWAEDSTIGYLDRSNLSSRKVYQLCDDNGLVSKLRRSIIKRTAPDPS